MLVEMYKNTIIYAALISVNNIIYQLVFSMPQTRASSMTVLEQCSPDRTRFIILSQT